MTDCMTIGEASGAATYLDELSPHAGGGWRLESNCCGARHGELLFAEADRAEKVLVFEPRLSGRHAIYVTCFSPAARQFGIYIRLSGEPHFTYLQTQRREPSYEEMFFKSAELAGRSIEVANFGRDTALDYLRLVPVSDAAPAPRQGSVLGILDFADDAGISRPAGYEAGSAVRRHADAGYDLIMWKAYAVRCEYHTKIGEIRGYTDAGEAAQAADGLAMQNSSIASVLRQYDTMRQAVEVAHDVGLPIFGWARINNEFSRLDHQFSATTPFHLANPDKFQQHRDGSFTCKLSFAYPEVRRHKIDILCEIAAYGMDGIFVDVLRHPAMALYDGPLVDAFIAQTGRDPRQMANDGDDEWLHFRCGVFTQFLREATAALDRQAGRSLPLYVRTVDQPWRNLQIGCDVETWIDEGIVDGIVFGPHCADASNYPDSLDLRTYVEKSAGRVKIYGQVWRYGSALQAEALARDLYAQGVDGVALYESNATVAMPSLRPRLARLGCT